MLLDIGAFLAFAVSYVAFNLLLKQKTVELEEKIAKITTKE